MKQFIKLINNERLNPAINSAKGCTGAATDICTSGTDYAICSSNSYDYCGKDYAACYNQGYDYCATTDTDACGADRDIN